MNQVFVAVAAVVTTSGAYEDIEVDVATHVVSTRFNALDAESDLLAWAKRQHQGNPGADLRLSVTTVHPDTGQVVGTRTYRVAPTIDLVRDNLS